jgi:hypothetical protein
MKFKAIWAISACGLLAACGRPPLRIQPSGQSVRVDVQTLGEYKTTVGRIRLSCDGQRTWEVLAGSDSSQIHGFTLRPGVNPCYQDEVSEPEYRVVFPVGSPNFEIRAGAVCALEIWGSGTAVSRAEFAMGAAEIPRRP